VGRPSEAPTRYRAVPLHRVRVRDQHDGRAPDLPDVSEASVGANPEATLLRHAGEAVSGTMLWFDEAKDFGFISTEEGERIYVHRSGFLQGETLVGGARSAVRLTATVQNGKRVAVDVSMAPEVAHGRARRRSSNIRSVRP
jgi:cold shock CspA family protein